MAARTFMIKRREKLGLSLEDMARKCDVSKDMLIMLESCDRDHTLPGIAQRIGKAYKLTEKQTESLMPEHRRPSSPKYNPDLFKIPDDENVDFSLRGGRP